MRHRWRDLARGRHVFLRLAVAVFVASAGLLIRADAAHANQAELAQVSSEPPFSAAPGATAPPPSGRTGALERRRAELESARNAPVLGNPKGDVTVVEFFDYNCPYCKRVADDVRQLIAEDPGIRLVYREWPILGAGSQLAARAALAAQRQGRYEQMHRALMDQPRVTEQSVLRAAQAVGLDMPRLRRDMQNRKIERHIAESFQLARELGINGTPAFVIGDRITQGLITPEKMRAYVREARAAKTGRPSK